MKTAFWGLFTIGLAACTTFGIGKSLERAGGSWTTPAMLAGIVLGVAILGLAAAFATGLRPHPLSTDTSMLVALAVLIGGKIGVSVAQAAFAAMTRG